MVSMEDKRETHALYAENKKDKQWSALGMLTKNNQQNKKKLIEEYAGDDPLTPPGRLSGLNSCLW